MLKSSGPPEGETGFPAENRVTCVFCNDAFEIAPHELSGPSPDADASPNV